MMNQTEQYIALVAIGVVGYLGKLLYSKQRLSIRNLIGSGIIGGLLGTMSAIALLYFPTMPFIVMAGIAAAIATIGHEMFKQIVEAFVYKATGKDIDKKDE